MAKWISIGSALLLLMGGTAYLYLEQSEHGPQIVFADKHEGYEGFLDMVAASNYLPDEVLWKVVLQDRYYDDTLQIHDGYVSKHGSLISERFLVERAKKLLANRFPNKQFTLFPCHTDNCSGAVFMGVRIRRISVPTK